LLLKIEGQRDVADRSIKHARGIQNAIDQLNHDRGSTRAGSKKPTRITAEPGSQAKVAIDPWGD